MREAEKCPGRGHRRRGGARGRGEAPGCAGLDCSLRGSLSSPGRRRTPPFKWSEEWTDKDVRKPSTVAPTKSTSDEASVELTVPSLIPPYNSLSGFNVPADSFQPVSFAGLGLPDRPGSSGPSAPTEAVRSAVE